MAIIVFQPSRMTFIHIPKTGGNSISDWLRKRTVCKTTKRKQHANLNEILKGNHSLGKLELNELGFLFCVVRNPWDYCVSWYKFKIQLCETYIDEISKKNITSHNLKKDKWNLQIQQNQLRRLKNLGFKNWLNQTKRKPQYYWAKDCDIVLHLETLSKDFQIIQNKIGNYDPLPYLNKTKLKNTNYKEYYDQESIEIVYSKFKIDVETYGYDF